MSDTKGYPIILDGDHAEFEREHANTPPHERPDWPLPSFDACDWAAAFLKRNPDCGVDEGLLQTWFANALVRGFDEHAARTSAAIRDAVKAEKEACAFVAEFKRLVNPKSYRARGYNDACDDIATAIRERTP